MKRAFQLTTNLGLVVVSVWAAIGLLRGIDALAKPFLPEPEWPSPFAGLIFSPGHEEDEDMFSFSCNVKMNSLGFRDRECTVAKTCRIRALAIGDSFTYGWGVNLEDAWCKRLESNLRRQGIDIEILDLGKPGAGPEEYCRIAECAVPRLKPDLIIVGMLQTEDLLSMSGTNPDIFLKDCFGNLILLYRCVRFNHIQHWPAGKKSSADVTKDNAKLAQDLAAELSEEERARLDKLEPCIKQAFFEGRLNAWQIVMGIQHPDNWKEWMTQRHMPMRIKRTAGRFRRIQCVARQYGVHVVVVSIPNGFNVNRESVSNWQRMGFVMDPAMLQSDDPDDSVAQACRQAGIASFHTVTSDFRKHIDEKGLYYELDQHMTPAGNALFADLITPMIAEDIRKAAAQNPALASSPH